MAATSRTDFSEVTEACIDRALQNQEDEVTGESDGVDVFNFDKTLTIRADSGLRTWGRFEKDLKWLYFQFRDSTDVAVVWTDRGLGVAIVALCGEDARGFPRNDTASMLVGSPIHGDCVFMVVAEMGRDIRDKLDMEGVRQRAFDSGYAWYDSEKAPAPERPQAIAEEEEEEEEVDEEEFEKSLNDFDIMRERNRRVDLRVGDFTKEVDVGDMGAPGSGGLTPEDFLGMD